MIQNFTIIRNPDDCPYASVGMNDMRNKTRKWVTFIWKAMKSLHAQIMHTLETKVKLSNLIILFMIVVVLFVKSVFYLVPTGKLFGAEHVHHSLHSALDYKQQGSLVSESCQLVK